MTNIFDCLYAEHDGLDIFSRYSFDVFLRKIYFDYDYTLFYSDFRELGKANHLLGEEMTNQLMSDCLRRVVSIFPNDEIGVRIAGDEYLFIVPTCSLNKRPEDYISDINLSLSKLRYDDFRPYMDFVAISEEKNTYLDSAFMKAKEQMDVVKLEQQRKFLISDNSMDLEISSSLLPLFNNFRIGQIQDSEIFFGTLNALSAAFRDVYCNLDQYLMSVKKYDYFDVKNKQENFSQGKFYRNFYEAIKNDDHAFFYDHIQEARKINEKLKRSSIQGYYNLLYYKNNFCVEKKRERFYGVYLELEGLKTINTLLGHDQADELLKKVYEVIDTNFSSKEVYCFDFLSARSLILSKSSEDINNDSLKESIQYINDTVFCNLKVHLSYYPILKSFSPNEIYSLIASYDEKNRNEKDKHKQEVITSHGGKMVIAMFMGHVFEKMKSIYTDQEAFLLLDRVLYDEASQIIQENKVTDQKNGLKK